MTNFDRTYVPRYDSDFMSGHPPDLSTDRLKFMVIHAFETKRMYVEPQFQAISTATQGQLAAIELANRDLIVVLVRTDGKDDSYQLWEHDPATGKGIPPKVETT